VFSHLLIEPLIDRAVGYEAEREHAEAQLLGGSHERGQELFSRAVQENIGAAIGITAFSIAMGVLFAVTYCVVRAVLARRGRRADPIGLALLVAAGMFVAIALMPGLKYPANPPGVGLHDTVAARSSAFLTITVISVVSASVALAAGLAWSRRWGGWPASLLALGGYLAVMLGAIVLLPNFHEVPGPVTGRDGLVLDGFPAEVLAEFRLYSLINQAVMWLLIGATFGYLAARHIAAQASSRANPSNAMAAGRG
jgi:predicted cobalt transporter CbtA